MEYSSPVEHHTPSSAQHAPSFWETSAGSGPFTDPSLVSQIDELLGPEAEPDPAFFVESWTLGIDTAARNFHQRRSAPAPRNAAPAASFRFAVPLVFLAEGDPPFSMPAGAAAAWKNAYGFNPSTAAGYGNDPSADSAFPGAPGLPLTAQDACRVLGLSPSCTRAEIKTAYRNLARRYHPDRLVHCSEPERRLATDRMTALNKAYRLLSTHAGSAA